MDVNGTILFEPARKLIERLPNNTGNRLMGVPDIGSDQRFEQWRMLRNRFSEVTSSPQEIRAMAAISGTSLALRSFLSELRTSMMVGFLSYKRLVVEPIYKIVPREYFEQRLGKTIMIEDKRMLHEIWINIVYIIYSDALSIPIPGIQRTHKTPLGARIILPSNLV